MSRKKNKQSIKPKPTISENQSPGIVRFLPIILALILAGIPFMLGKYMELNMPGPFDSGAYVHSAKNIIEGARYGVDEIASARPGTLLANIIGVKLFGYNDVGPKIVQGLMQLAALCLMFYMLKRVYGSAAAVIGVAIASFYLSAPVICKYGNVKEQYMIALVIITACGFILRQVGGRWWWPVIAGAAVINIYYFKATGLSVAIAMMVYFVTVLCMKRRTPKHVFFDVFFLLIGAVVGLLPLLIFHMQQDAVGRLMRTLPVYMIAAGLCIVAASFVIYRLLTITSRNSGDMQEQAAPEKSPKLLVGIAFAVVAAILVILGFKFGLFAKIKNTVFASGGYLDWSRSARTYADQAEYVFRYYGVLKLPVILACLAIIISVVRFIKRQYSKVKTEVNPLDTLVLFMSVWWILDMAFVWVSPRPYEQYYLPLNASAAMLAAYVIWRYCESMNKPSNKGIFIAGSVIGIFVMFAMAWPVYAGLSNSPYSGTEYKDRQGKPSKNRGYVQRLKEVSDSRKYTAPWKAAGRYIKDNSAETDRMYVWGWIPGIYIQAQRLSAFRIASEGNMHVMPPLMLRGSINNIMKEFEAKPPKFIVDTRKRHYPNDRPPLELWPRTARGYLPVDNDSIIASYDMQYGKAIEQKFGKDEAMRYEYMGLLREFIRDNYKIVPRQFGGGGREIVVFERLD